MENVGLISCRDGECKGGRETEMRGREGGEGDERGYKKRDRVCEPSASECETKHSAGADANADRAALTAGCTGWRCHQTKRGDKAVVNARWRRRARSSHVRWVLWLVMS
jgi:hypothetical protein